MRPRRISLNFECDEWKLLRQIDYYRPHLIQIKITTQIVCKLGDQSAHCLGSLVSWSSPRLPPSKWWIDWIEWNGYRIHCSFYYSSCQASAFRGTSRTSKRRRSIEDPYIDCVYVRIDCQRPWNSWYHPRVNQVAIDSYYSWYLRTDFDWRLFFSSAVVSLIKCVTGGKRKNPG